MVDISYATKTNPADNMPERKISVTHYVNPHLFWFKFHDVLNEVSDMERQLSVLFEERATDTAEIYKVNDYVAVRMTNHKRYIRGVIKALETRNAADKEEESYIVWALDHGQPLRTTHAQLRWLPLEFLTQRRFILRGGIANIWPLAELLCKFDGQKRYQCVDKWSPTAHQELGALLQSNAQQIYAKLCFVENVENVEHYWCDLRVTLPNGQHTTAAQHLAKANLGQIFALDLFRLKRSRLTTYKEHAWQHVVEQYQPNEPNFANSVGFFDVGQENDACKQLIEVQYLSEEKNLHLQQTTSVQTVTEPPERQVFALNGSNNFRIVAANRT